MSFEQMLPILARALGETLQMVTIAILLGTAAGLPLGVFLATGRQGEVLAAPKLHLILGVIVNIGRSIPFLILAVAIFPLTRLLVGTAIGTWAAVVPLTLAAIPFIARVTEAALREVEPGLIEAARAMGARPVQIVGFVLLPEALPGLILGLTLTIVSLIANSAMVGAVGGGGLGDLGLRFGHQRFMPEVMAAVVLVLVVLVQGLQSLGETLARRVNRRTRRP